MVIHTNQSSLFSNTGDQALPRPQIDYREDWCVDHESLFTKMQNSLVWNRQFRSRHTVSFGMSYTTKSGLRYTRAFPDWLVAIADQVARDFGYAPNNCLVNYYPTGEHYISFHSDQDMEMTTHSGVTIVSFGTMRQMELRLIDNHRLRYAYPLAPGSAFYMEDRLQKTWQHGILVQRDTGPRISLSFRALKQPVADCP